MAELLNRRGLAGFFNELGFKKGAEIGVAGGRNSRRFCMLIPGLRLYCVDPWSVQEDYQWMDRPSETQKNYFLAKERLAPYDAHLIRATSMDAVRNWEEELDFVFIDGNHKFDYVMQDIIEWGRVVRQGGYISGHDYRSRFPGVVTAVNAYVEAHDARLFLGDEGIWFVEKTWI